MLDEAGKAMEAQHKFRLRACKYRRKENACGRAQQEVDEIRGIANYRLQQWGQTARVRDELHNQLMNLTIERDEAPQELDRVTRHRDAALELAEERRRGWIWPTTTPFKGSEHYKNNLKSFRLSTINCTTICFLFLAPYQGIQMWVELK